MIERIHLEDWMPLDKARELVDEFLGDRVTYPDHDFYSRKRGVNKDIPEEYYPLVLLGESLSGVKAIRLSPDSFPGCDGALLLEDESTVCVQVTLAHERDYGCMVRHSLRDTGQYIPAGGAHDTMKVVEQRKKRILDAIGDKESKFRTGTDVLLVVDESISSGDVIDPALPHTLEAALNTLPDSRYAATYILFGSNLRKVR